MKRKKIYSGEGVKNNRIHSSSSWAYDAGGPGIVTGPMRTSDALVKPRVKKKAASKKPAIDFGNR